MSAPRHRRGSLRDLEARLQSTRGERQRWGSHSRSRLQRLFQELPAEWADEVRELMMLPGYAELRPANPREVIEFYVRLPAFARAAIRKALRDDAIGEPVLGTVLCTRIRRGPVSARRTGGHRGRRG